MILREIKRHAGILRIDHILGMNRSFWLPDDGSSGDYVSQPFESFVAVIAIEAQKAGCLVIGEDLGLVPDGLRKAIRARGLFGCSALQYEKTAASKFRNPNRLRQMSLVCFATHDTPTIKGFQIGRDIEWWKNLGRMSLQQSEAANAKRAVEVSALSECDVRSSVGIRDNIHNTLVESSARTISVQLGDILNEKDAQNLPGTIDERPNWQRRCAAPLEKLTQCESLVRTGLIMTECGRNRRPVHAKEEFQ